MNVLIQKTQVSVLPLQNSREKDRDPLPCGKMAVE